MIMGNNPILLNVTYNKPDKKKEIEESFEVVYKTDTGVYLSYEDPEVEFYVVKPEYRDFNYNKPQELLSRMDKVTCKVSEIRYKIAEAIGDEGLQFIRQCYASKNFGALNRLYKWRYAFAADFQPEYYYMKRWYKQYPLREDIHLSKAFIDIELDMMDDYVDLENLQNTAHAPVNCVTVAFEDTSEVFTFILRPFKPSRLKYGSEEEYQKRYKLYEDQLAQHQKMMSDLPGMINRIHKDFDATYGELIYTLKEYEEEIQLIADIFRTINERKPNYCTAWNMRFDIQYLIERTKFLGYNPASVMCHKDFKNPRVFFKVDRSTYLLEKQFDYCYCSSYTQYICAMRMYSSIRKSESKLPSVSLNAISDRELGDQKVEYPKETNIRLFPYKDWKLFIIYNIKDVLLFKQIEKKTNDVMTYYTRSHFNLTPYSKIFKETHLIRNFREKYFEEFEGKAQSNNINVIDADSDDLFNKPDVAGEEEKEASFKGAINADPVWNDHVGMEILGSKSKSIFMNAMDYDMGAFYPSIKIACNMDPETLIFKASFDNEDFKSGEFNNKSLNQTYEEKDKHNNLRPNDITGEAVNTYVSNNPLTFGYNYLSLPSVTELQRELERRKR